MTGANTPDGPEPFEVEIEPTIAGRIARWTQRVQILRTRIDAARAEHASIDLGLTLIERDSSIGGGLLSGALAYRLFVLLLPSSLLFVSGLGLYAGSVDQSPGKVAKDAGLQGLIASEVAKTASSSSRGVVFVLMLPVVVYATVKLYRAIAITHGIVWHGSGRGIRVNAKGVGLLGVALLAAILAAEIVGWIRRNDQLVGVASLVVYTVLVGAAWLAVSWHLPRRDVRWTALVPGAALFGAGLLFVNVFNVYVTTRLVHGRANTYGALGIAAALLLSLVLVGRLVVFSAELNAALDERRAGGRRAS